MNYDPSLLQDRKDLAARLESMFLKAKFIKISDETTEDVYEFNVAPSVNITVFSSIYRGAVRTVGADAIRVAVLYRRRDGQLRSLVSEANVHRTGTVEGITDRTLQRMRAAFVGFTDREKRGLRCRHCGAPFHLSKRGNEVCAEACWTAR